MQKKKSEFGFETVNVGFTNVLYKCSQLLSLHKIDLARKWVCDPGGFKAQISLTDT